MLSFFKEFFIGLSILVAIVIVIGFIVGITMIPASILWFVLTYLKLGTMLTFLPAYWQAVPFLHMYGYTIVLGVLKGLIFPNAHSLMQRKLAAVNKELNRQKNNGENINFEKLKNAYNETA